MIEMYKDYIKEREGKELIYNDKGFAIYCIHKNECYLQDVYVKPEFRKQGVATELADQVFEIAKKEGCTHFTSTVCPHAKSATESLKVLTAYGFRLLSTSHDRIVFYKEVK